MKEYLDALDLTVDIDIQTLPVGREKNYKTVFTQPGMRYSQAKELVQSLLEDEEFQELSIDERNAVKMTLSQRFFCKQLILDKNFKIDRS